MQWEESKVSEHLKREMTKLNLIHMIHQWSWNYVSTMYAPAMRMNLS